MTLTAVERVAHALKLEPQSISRLRRFAAGKRPTRGAIADLSSRDLIKHTPAGWVLTDLGETCAHLYEQD